MSDQALVSIIVPVYNAEQWLRRCLDSIFAQTMRDFELIVVNDGSTDSSSQILLEYVQRHPNMRVLEQDNAGQGAARNRALDLAQGRYVLFVDADDFIESVTLQVTTTRAEEDQSDLVRFDSKLYSRRQGQRNQYDYIVTGGFWGAYLLEGAECDELLRTENQYSVTALYRRSFLEEFGIRFEEGRIYEDNPFVVQSVNRARRASLLHSPLYIIDPLPNSTTRAKLTNAKTYIDHVHAVRRSFELLNDRNPRSKSYLAAYHVKKFANYYGARVLGRFRAAYARDFVEALHTVGIDGIAPGAAVNAPTRLYVRLGIFDKSRHLIFRVLTVAKNLIMPSFKRAMVLARDCKRRLTPNGPWAMRIERALKRPIVEGTVSFLGFDSLYTGNSRYLFEQMTSDPRFEFCDIRFVTDDPAVDASRRLPPNTPRTNEHLARSQLLIAESWIPPHVRKHRDSTWVQLWHGTPLKRMLFDSPESGILRVRPQHKVAKYRDIQQWDYLVVDSEAAVEKFETAFLFSPGQMIRSGYPRVKHLLENRCDERVKTRVFEDLGIDMDTRRRVLLYAPTWRDYNYGRTSVDTNSEYLLDIETLADRLGEGWLILFHDHGYLAGNMRVDVSNCIDASGSEIQDLLLAADVVVSDYSSLVFDALAIGKQVLLYARDRERFEQSRGLYADFWVDLELFTVESLEDLHQRLKSRPDIALIRDLREKYCFDPRTEMSEFLMTLLDVGNGNDS